MRNFWIVPGSEENWRQALITKGIWGLKDSTHDKVYWLALGPNDLALRRGLSIPSVFRLFFHYERFAPLSSLFHPSFFSPLFIPNFMPNNGYINIGI